MNGKRPRLPADLDHTNAYTDDSDSSDNSDYNQNEKILLSKVKQKRNKDSESEDEALFDVASDKDSGNKSDFALSDVEENYGDDLPNVKAWGKDKRSYYSTDYVDQDYGGHAGRDALNADFEEEEAQNLQLQLSMQLEDEDFLLFDAMPKKSTFTKAPKTIDVVVKPDVSNLTKRQQTQLLLKESPEFFNLVKDFKEKMVLVKDVLLPAKELFEKGQIPKTKALNFILIYQSLLLNYCINITMYLVLKSNRVKLQSHPIIKRLLQYRQLINKMEPIYEKNIAEKLVHRINNDKIDRKRSQLKEIALEKLKKSKPKPKIEKKVSKVVHNKETRDLLKAFEKEVAELIVNEDTEENEGENEADEKRAITYQMKKNKGLMSARKKEQRNPRVKHRNKFRKAQIRRKGAVRKVRSEINRYGGEISGIKASVAKSIKIK